MPIIVDHFNNPTPLKKYALSREREATIAILSRPHLTYVTDHRTALSVRRSDSVLERHKAMPQLNSRQKPPPTPKPQAIIQNRTEDVMHNSAFAFSLYKDAISPYHINHSQYLIIYRVTIQVVPGRHQNKSCISV